MNIVFFTGAGISQESGIPTFRGKDGIFKEEDNDAEEELTLSRFMKTPEKSWIFLRKIFNAVEGKTYNNAHKLITAFKDSIVITQNIDSFHEDAGSNNVLHLHGEFGTGTCTSCKKESKIKERCECGGWIKPDITFYDEQLDVQTYSAAKKATKKADIFVIIGTTGLVYPAANIPKQAYANGAIIVEINPEKSAYTDSITDYFIQEQAVKGMKIFKSNLNSLSSEIEWIKNVREDRKQVINDIRILNNMVDKSPKEKLKLKYLKKHYNEYLKEHFIFCQE